MTAGQKALKVVLADDNDITRTMLRSILRQENMEILGESRDGLGAIAQCDLSLPHLVCLDVEMERMNGIEALKEIKTRWPKVGVLMVTSHSERETVQAALKNGADGYIVKPFNAEKVLEAVRRVMAKMAAAGGFAADHPATAHAVSSAAPASPSEGAAAPGKAS